MSGRLKAGPYVSARARFSSTRYFGADLRVHDLDGPATDDFNGAFVACPDPIDFRAYTVVNLYEDENAYCLDSVWKKTPRPGHRNYLGHVSATLEEMNRRELVLGTTSRSGQQWDIREAVPSPVVD